MHLSDYMYQRRLTDEEVAAAIGRTRATVSRIRRRKVRPRWGTIQILRRWSGAAITAADFEKMDEAAEPHATVRPASGGFSRP